MFCVGTAGRPGTKVETSKGRLGELCSHHRSCLKLEWAVYGGSEFPIEV